MRVDEPVTDVEDQMPRGAKEDAIPAIQEPRFTDGRWLDPEDEVIGVAMQGQARAYPLRVLDKHEIVNDEIAGVPIAVTFCPLCGSGRVYDRRVDDRELTFEVSGRLYRNDLVMQDEQTGSLWPQILGKALHGPLAGATLDPIQAPVTTWRAWQGEHERSRVLARPDIYRKRAYATRSHSDYETRSGAVFDRVNDDPRLSAKTWVYGVKRGDDALAIELEDLREVGPTIVVVDGETVVLDHVRDRPVGWWLGDRDVRIQDGIVLGPEGQRLNPLTGKLGEDQLAWAEGLACYWLAWAEFAPETRLWQ